MISLRNMHLKVKKIHEDAILPKYAHPGDVGLDLYSLEDYVLQPGELKIFYLGFALEFDSGHAALMKDKSSMGGKGIHCLGGVFDSGYRGEYNVALMNHSAVPFPIQKKQKIAQLVIFPVIIAELEEVSELSESSRGTGAFGSTGKF